MNEIKISPFQYCLAISHRDKKSSFLSRSQIKGGKLRGHGDLNSSSEVSVSHIEPMKEKYGVGVGKN
jgi:hypothetical protein